MFIRTDSSTPDQSSALLASDNSNCPLLRIAHHGTAHHSSSLSAYWSDVTERRSTSQDSRDITGDVSVLKFCLASEGISTSTDGCKLNVASLTNFIMRLQWILTAWFLFDTIHSRSKEEPRKKTLLPHQPITVATEQYIQHTKSILAGSCSEWAAL